MNKPTYENFKKFCLNKKPDDVIDNERWCTCAVGEYLWSIGFTLNSEIGELWDLVENEETKEVLREFQRDLRDNHIFNALNERYFYYYGEIQEFVK